ncbi:MAG: hypothetical protein U5L45_26850 [Saprospiraceae bacterium]|nr:hypothetical protein [Saprospiraceae bacterium]
MVRFSGKARKTNHFSLFCAREASADNVYSFLKLNQKRFKWL